MTSTRIYLGFWHRSRMPDTCTISVAPYVTSFKARRGPSIPAWPPCYAENEPYRRRKGTRSAFLEHHFPKPGEPCAAAHGIVLSEMRADDP